LIILDFVTGVNFCLNAVFGIFFNKLESNLLHAGKTKTFGLELFQFGFVVFPASTVLCAEQILKQAALNVSDRQIS
jgi:hypothetical protein